MLRFWIKFACFSAVVAGLFAGLAGLSVGEATVAKEKGLALLGALLRSLLVDPLGMPLAIATVFALMMGICGFFALGREGEAPALQQSEVVRPVEHRETQTRPAAPPVAGPPARTFGKKIERERIFAPDGTELPPREPGSLAIFAVRENGFDWYFSHHGYEQNWKKAESSLRAMGRHDLAVIMAEAGPHYDWFTDTYIHGCEDDPPQDATTAYLERMRAWSKAFDEAAEDLG